MHILIEALQLDKSLPVTLDVYGTTQSENGAVYAARVKKLVGDDPRIRFRSPVPPDQVVRTLRQYDMLVVPSQWLETGPLVVLEAFAAGIPVLGSNLGGIAELVADSVNGFLVDAQRPASWLTTLRRLIADLYLLNRMQLTQAPSMSTTTAATIDLYRRLARIPATESAKVS